MTMAGMKRRHPIVSDQRPQQQARNDGFPWKIYRDGRGSPRWWQRWYEAWMVVTGRYTFWHAYDQGKHRGAMDEYQRVVVNGGDLVPIIDAAIYATASEILNGQEPQAEVLNSLRMKAWKRFKDRPNAPVGQTRGQS